MNSRLRIHMYSSTLSKALSQFMRNCLAEKEKKKEKRKEKRETTGIKVRVLNKLR